jgi:hypothetical protein
MELGWKVEIDEIARLISLLWFIWYQVVAIPNILRFEKVKYCGTIRDAVVKFLCVSYEMEPVLRNLRKTQSQMTW